MYIKKLSQRSQVAAVDPSSDLVVVIRRVHDGIALHLFFEFQVRAGSLIRTEVQDGSTEVLFSVFGHGF